MHGIKEKNHDSSIVFHTGQDDIAHWRIAFDIAAVVYLVGNVVFVIFGSGEEQDFNLIDDIDDGKRLMQWLTESIRGH